MPVIALGRNSTLRVAALAASLVWAAAAAPPAVALEDVMEPGEVSVVDGFTPAGPVATPTDGRIRGYGFAAVVEQVAEAAKVERLLFDLRAPEGHRLVVFVLGYEVEGSSRIGPPVVGTLAVDGARRAVDFPFAVDGRRVVAAAVPLGARRVELELASGGLVQTFSLTERRRVGAQPAVLYRDPTGPQVVSDLDDVQVVRAADDEVVSSVALRVRRVRLSWFAPTAVGTEATTLRAVTPSSPDRAFLVIEGGGEDVGARNGGGAFETLGTIPAGDVRMRLPGGKLVAARHTDGTGGLLAGAYYFEVPTDTTTATLLVGPATVDARRRGKGATEVRLDRATFELALPGGGPLVASSGSESGGRSWAWLAVVVPALLAVAVGGAQALRRRRSGRPQEDSSAAGASAADADDGEAVDVLALATDGRLDLGGPGALAALRAAVLRPAVDSEGTPVVVLAQHDTEPLVSAGADAPPWVTVVHDEDALWAAVEVARLRRARLDHEGDPDDDTDDGTTAGGWRLVVVVPATLGGEARRRLRPPVEGGASLDDAAVDDIAVVTVGEGAALVVGEGGRLTHCDDGRAGGRVLVVPDGDAAAWDRPSEGGSSSSPARPQVVDVRLLGRCRITVGDHEVASGLRTKARELLAFLAVHRHGASADAAVEALWPGGDPDQAYFRTVLANLRTVLRTATGAGDDVAMVERTGQQYRLDAGRFEVDLWRFDDLASAAARGDDEVAEAAADAYGGDLVEGDDYPWAEPRREQLRRRALDNLTALADRRRAAGDLQGALVAAERAIGRDPYSEELYQRVMQLHRDLGRPDAARRTYEALASCLGELGLDPSPRSRALGTGVEA